MWIGASGEKLISAPIAPILNLKYALIYNITIEDNNSLFAVYNIAFAYAIIPAIIFLICLFISKKSPGLITSRTKRFILYDLSYAWMLVNGYLIIFGASLSIT